MKKYIMSLLITILLVCLLVGCGGNNNSSKPNGNGDKKWQGEELFISARKAGYGQWLDDYATLFEDETGCEVNIVWDPNMNQTVRNIFNSSQYVLSDLYFGGVSDLWYKWAKDGLLYDIDGFDDLLQDEYKDLGTYNNKRYTLSAIASPLGFVYNQDLLDKIESNGAYVKGVFPETFEGLMDLCEAVNNSGLKVGNNDVKPMSWGGKVNELNEIFRVFWAQGNGGQDYTDYTNERGDVPTERLFKNNKSLINALTAMCELIASDGSYSVNSVKGCLELDNIDQQKKFLNGESVFCMTGGWFEVEMKDYITDESPKYCFANIPLYDTEETVRTALINIPVEVFFVPKKAINPDIAVDFLKFVFSKENATSIHKKLGSPLTIKYEFTEDDYNALSSDFAKQVTDVVKNCKPVLKFANNPMCMVGGVMGTILDSKGNTIDDIFSVKMMKKQSGYTINDIATIVENNYIGYKLQWNDKLKAAGLK